MSIHSTVKQVRRGFTLVEPTAVIVIIGVLAYLVVPTHLKSVERSKAAEAFLYLSTVRDANERYLVQHGVYANGPSSLDLEIQPPKNFAVTTYSSLPGSSTSRPSWTMTLTRASTSSSPGAYTVTFTHDGFDPTQSTITASPEINPLGKIAFTAR